MNPMNWLQTIGCYLLKAVAWLLKGIVFLVDKLIEGIGALGAFGLGLLPDFPERPPIPSDLADAASAVNWFIPVGTYVGVFVVTGTLMLIWYVAVVALRWAKAVE